MKVLVLYDYPPTPGGLATQGDLLYRGLLANGVEAHAVHLESALEKQWYYNWFKPDVVVGTGYWGHTPQLVLHPQKHGMTAVPWLVADGYIANYQNVLNELPLILVTSHWVKEMYVRDGISGNSIEVLPVGCDTDTFRPYPKDDPKVLAARKALAIQPEEQLLLTIGGDAASKGAREVMEALAIAGKDLPPWKYVCKVWPQPRTALQSNLDQKLAEQLGISNNVIFQTSIISRDFIPYMLNACDIYAAPSRLEGFGMPQVEAGSCGKPVIGIKAMGMLDTLVDNETALLAGVGQKIVVNEVTLGSESGYEENRRIVFEEPRTVDYRADVTDIKDALIKLMNSTELQEQLGSAARKRVAENFDYRIVAAKFVKIINERLQIY
ncbi:glycosyltransferase [Flavobacterium circumlabens]|uniref:Glycosyl transferase family 1 n=1 Tax=Flavobacterium circumlabens TaxID=2133765 RepID=A0A4Y7UCY2_9FLAO|nr:glycosyltransferase family 4 protein [Flavobacterium circumlabens]TCN58902.1 glycosyl transferase family 1 [Flavobacterium circumlabens]TEB44310.1 glycosyltransferase [Flavobacterium circumlabens]